jgi:serine protease Do
VKLTIIRNGKVQTVSVRLAERASEEADAVPQTPTTPSSTSISTRDLTASEKSQLGVDNGVLITNVRAGSNAANAGITTGSVVTWVNRQNITSAKQFESIISAVSRGSTISMRIISRQGARFVAFEKD